MSIVRKIGIVLLGLLLGGCIGLLGGLAYTQLVGTSAFEGYSGFVVIYWILGGIVLGLAAGVTIAVGR